MDPFSLIGSLINGAGGVLGGLIGGGQQQAAQQAIINAQNIWKNLQLPPSQALPIILNQFKQAGIYTPQLEQAVTQATSKFSSIPEDTQTIQAQQQALQQLQQRGKVGLNAEDRVALNQIRNQAGADAEARRQQILQNFAQMGYGGRNSGAALAQQLQAAQSSSNQEAQQANQQAAVAAQRALQALNDTANLTGQIRSQNFDIASQKAQAEDAMNRFNIQNQMGQQQFNVNNQNQANLFNLQNLQSINNQNVGQNNAELQRQRQGQQQDYLNALLKAQQEYQAALNAAKAQTAQAGYTQGAITSIGSALGQGLNAYGQYQNNQPQATQAGIPTVPQISQLNSSIQNYKLPWQE